MRNAFAAALLLLLLATAAAAQNRADYNQYLVPLSTREVRGAGGSVWKAEWAVHNFWFTPVDMIWAHCPPNVSPCPSRTILPLVTTRPELVPRGDGTDGAFVYVPKSDDPLIGMSLRVRDLSRNAQNFGTEIPIVGTDEYTNAQRPALYLLDIPTDAKYRATLRIYGADQAPVRVQISVYPEDSTLFVEQYFVNLHGIVNVLPEPFPLHPSYTQLDPLTRNVRASGERVRIIVHAQLFNGAVPPQIVPVWAFLTLTNNDTQQVTLVTHSK